MFQGLEHAAIASPNPEKLALWYVEHLGYTINFFSPASKTTFIRAPNGSMFEIITSEGERAQQAMRSPGLRHLAITVDNFQEDYEWLKAKGVKFLTEPEIKGGNSLAFFEDPDGNILHLIQREKPLP
jgi:glyoxylase I family protein